MNNFLWSHEESYKGNGIRGLIHRRRLNNILKIFKTLNVPHLGKLADFGCSNGYIIHVLKKSIFSNKQWYFYGFDYFRDLLDQAKKRNFKDTEFHYLNLNLINNELMNNFDIIICLETLEHVNDYRTALTNLYNSCKPGGVIIISVPNEKGIPGLAKYVAKKIFREKSHSIFFDKQKNEWGYFIHLILNRNLEIFREQGNTEWGHLGFDINIFYEFINKTFVSTGKVKLCYIKNSFFKFNFIYVIKKIF